MKFSTAAVASALFPFVSVVAAASEDAPECDLTCLASPPQRDLVALRQCLNAAFPSDGTLLGFHQVPKVTFPEDPLFTEAARVTNGYTTRVPAGIVMAENENDVVEAVKCATSAGYKISPRGKGHHYQALSTMDGYLVIDCSLICDPESFIWESVDMDWLLPDQKVIGTVESGSGCTNAVMLAASHKRYGSSGGLYAIGTCPSVGIIGYSTGGGSGDITPYTGWGADDFLEVRMVLWDGSIVVANATHNSDLYWATQGGGSGFGVITSIKTVVPQAPEPLEGEDTRKYCYVTVGNSASDEVSKRHFLASLQDFLYDSPAASSKFGGGGALYSNNLGLSGIFLGSATEFLKTFKDYGLLDTAVQTYNSTLFQDYEWKCDGTEPCTVRDDLPSTGVEIHEFDSYGETMVYKLCKTLTPLSRWLAAAASMTQTTGNWCADLGISADYCTRVFPFTSMEECLALTGGSQESCDNIYFEPICEKPKVIQAMVEAAYDPLSFLNTGGFTPFLSLDPDVRRSLPGGLLIPRVDIDTLMKLTEVGIPINHFQHGAPMTKPSDATALPWRDTAIMTEFVTSEQASAVKQILADFYGDANMLQGYYNYASPVGNPNWRYYYFRENYERLSQIKLKYDPVNWFGNPIQVEPAFSTNSSGTSPDPTPPPKHGKKTKKANRHW